MIIEKRYFFEGMDGDSDPKLVSDKACLNIMNGRVAVSEFGRWGRVENFPGTTAVSQQVFPPYGTHQCLGSCPDIARNRILFINYNTFSDHGIYCLDLSSPATPVVYAVLYESQVTGGLNFSKTKRTDRDMRVVGDLLYWTDDNNEPRRINIEAGIKTNHASYVTDVAAYDWPMNPSVITVVRNPPAYPLTWEKSTDGGFAQNLIKKEAFQFYWGYDYRDGEQSVLSPLSTTANYNIDDGSAASLHNLITITAPFDETIPQDALRVHIVAKYLNGGKSFIIKTWDRDIAADEAEIDAHNAGTTALTYAFYNSQGLIAVSNTYAAKPFDLVPIRSKTLEYSDRLFLANNLDGYDTPLLSSLTAQVSSISTSGGGSLDVYLAEARFLINGTYFSYRAYFVNISTITPSGYYRLTNYTQTNVSTLGYPAYPTLPAVPATINVGEIAFVGTTTTDVQNSIGGSYITSFSFTDTGSNTTLSLAVGVSIVQKSDSTKQVGIVFFDKAMRRCGVYTNDNLIIHVPDRNFSLGTLYTGISWSLSNTNSVNEIPDWAYYYGIVVTKALEVLKFEQAVTNSIKYVTKDANGQFVYNDSVTGGEVGIAINTDFLLGYGMGYTFSEGDIAKIYSSATSTVFTVDVTGQDGQYIICSFVDLGNTTGDIFIYEIRTPVQYTEEPPFYEIGQIYEIVDPTLATRSYLVLNGSIGGDVHLAERTHSAVNYNTERMSPNDELWQNWNTDAGRVNYIDRIGQQWKKTSVKWSNTIIPGTRVNGLSTFDALDQKILQTELNEINKLQLASKIPEQGQGNVMLAVCTTQIASIYLGELQLTAAARVADVATTTNVIGTVNILKGSYGTQHKESIVEYLGLVFGIDVLNGVFWQYSQSGVEPVSRYKMARFFKNYCKGYLETNANNLDNINGFHHIPTCVDPFYKEVICTLPGLIYDNYADTLPSYTTVPSYATSIIDRFDIFDELGKTMAFKYEENNWGHNYGWMGEWYDYLQNTLIGWKNGLPYIHNSNTSAWNTVYGAQYPVRICVPANVNPSALKDLFNIAIEGNTIPNYVVAMTNYPNEQITDLASTDSQWVNQEGVFYATFMRDRLSPNASGTADQKMFTGDILKDFAIFVMCEWQVYNELFYCNFINIGYDISKGQKQIINAVNT